MHLTTLSVIFLALPYLGLGLSCYNCQTGYATSEVCSDQLPAGFVVECNSTNAQCYESIQWFHDGVLRLAMRGCWTPPENTTIGGFCENYNNPIGALQYCRNCTEDLCNTESLYSPVKLPNCDVAFA